MTIFNLSDKADYYSQRNNNCNPDSACNVTSIVQALDILGILPSVPKGMQPEDYLEQMTERQEITDWKNKYHPEFIGIPNRQIHECLEKVVNEWLGYEVDTYSEITPLNRIMYHIACGNPAVLSTLLAGDGHIITLVGFTTTQDVSTITSAATLDLNKIQTISINDPWGDPTSKPDPYAPGRYNSEQGKNITLDYKTFVKRTWKVIGNDNAKRAHLIRK